MDNRFIRSIILVVTLGLLFIFTGILKGVAVQPNRPSNSLHYDPSPVPTLDDISPHSALVNSPGLLLTATGGNFLVGSQIYWNSIPLSTTFLSSTDLIGDLQAGLLVSTGVYSITVYNPPDPDEGGGGPSSTITFTVENPFPTLAQIYPLQLTRGSADQTLVVTGTGFVNDSIIYWDTTMLSPTLVSGSEMTATILAALLTSPGVKSITVSNPSPGGGTSDPITLTVDNPKPAIDQISPQTLSVNSPAQTLEISGTGFLSDSIVYWDSTGLPTTFISGTSLTATIDSSLLTATGTFSITIANPLPGGGISNPKPLTVENSIAHLESISPDKILVGSPSQTLVLTGTGFVAGSTTYWDSTPLSTTVVSGILVTATVDSSLLTSTSSISITVFNPPPGGGVSNGMAVSVINPVAHLDSIHPEKILVGSPAQTLIITGTGFVAGSTVDWDSTPLSTTVISGVLMTATVDSSLLTSTSAISITVFNPPPGGGVSNGIAVSVENPVAHLVLINPVKILVGSPAQTLVITGTGFVAGSTVDWESTPLSTRLISSGRVEATISSALLTSTGTFSVTVSNPPPGGGTSNNKTISVENPIPGLALIKPQNIVIGSPSQTLIVTGTAFVTGSVIKWDSIPLSTTYYSSSRLNAIVPASFLTVSKSISISVVNPKPGGGTSITKPLVIENPAIKLDTIDPQSVLVGSNTFHLAITGSGFATGSRVYWDLSLQPTNVISGTKLIATIDASLLTEAKVVNITVFNPPPGGGTSAARVFTVANPMPVIVKINPQNAPVSSNLMSVTITGTGFIPDSLVYWDSIPLTTTYLSSLKLRASLLPGFFTSARIGTMRVINPGPGGGGSNGLDFMVLNPIPRINSIQPEFIRQGSAGFTLQISGSGFINAVSSLIWGNRSYPVSVSSPSHLSADILPGEVITAGLKMVTVSNPGPGGGDSNSLMFRVLNVVFIPAMVKSMPPPAPTLNSIDNGNGLGDFTITWSQVSNGSGYQLQQANLPDFSDAVTIYTGNQTIFQVTTLNPTRYYFRVSAISQKGTGQWSNIQQVDVLKEKEPNNSFSGANGPLISGLNYYGYSNDSMDLYKYEQKSSGSLVIDLNNTHVNGMDLVVYYQNANNRVAIKYDLPYHIELENQPPGTYFIYIYTPSNFDSTTAYGLSVIGR